MVKVNVDLDVDLDLDLGFDDESGLRLIDPDPILYPWKKKKDSDVETKEVDGRYYVVTLFFNEGEHGAGYRSIVLRVADTEGNILDWSLCKDFRDFDLLEKMYKEGSAERFKINEYSMKVPASTPRELAVDVKKRVLLDGFSHAYLYYIEDKVRVAVVDEEAKEVEDDRVEKKPKAKNNKELINAGK